MAEVHGEQRDRSGDVLEEEVAAPTGRSPLPRSQPLPEIQPETTIMSAVASSFLIGRRFHLGLQRRHLHHIGGQRVSGSVPCTNSVVVGRARFGGSIAESRDMPPHLADLYEWLARAVTGCSLNAEPESAARAFGPCQNHLATAAGDRHQIDGRRRKDGRRRAVGHSLYAPR